MKTGQGFSFSLRGEFDNIERLLLRLCGGIIILILLYSVFSYIIGKQISDKDAEITKANNEMMTQVGLVESDTNKIRTRKTEYTNAINKLKSINEQTTAKYKARNAIPNLLNRIINTKECTTNIYRKYS